MIKKQIQNLIKQAIKKSQKENKLPCFNIPEIQVEHPQNERFGDYSTNIAMNFSKIVKKPPMEIGLVISSQFLNFSKTRRLFDRVEVEKPGFINFTLSRKFLTEQTLEIIKKGDDFGKNKIGKGRIIMVEFAHPNTHKEFHIGHLRNIFIGESIARILEANGFKVVRANYQGDVGMHIAKCLYKIKNQKSKIKNLKTLDEKIEFLGKAYAEGSKMYETDEQAKKEIIELNKKIYNKDKSILRLWEETRKWSLEYFDKIYKRLGVKYDRFYFESEVWKEGIKIIREFLKKRVFEESEGAIIFDGERYGLHKRVFITREETPTYEAKDLELARLQFKEFNPDLILHVVGPEQLEYFKVVFKALELILPRIKGKEKHIAYGWVRLKHGKMSSRVGKVVRGMWLIDEAKKKIERIVSKSDKVSKNLDIDTAEKIAVGAVRYSFLKMSLNQEIVFDLDESISFEGASGPYLQYTYARICGILNKSKFKNQKLKVNYDLLKQEKEISLLRKLYIFPEIVEQAAQIYEPHLIATYIYKLAQDFNNFYNNIPVLKTKDDIRKARLALIKAVAQVIKNGLELLGIEVVERM